jgi:hypothetical protein
MKEAEFAVFLVSIGIGDNPLDLKVGPIENLWINLK